jgi:hypothetical protein
MLPTVIAALSSAARLSASYCVHPSPATQINGTHSHTSERDRHAPNSVATVFQLLRPDKLVAAMGLGHVAATGAKSGAEIDGYTHIPRKNMPWLSNGKADAARGQSTQLATKPKGIGGVK